jgi:hypothetical protein
VTSTKKLTRCFSQKTGRRYKVKQDRIKRKANRLYIRIDGEEKSVMQWLQDDRCSIDERLLRRRIEAYESGHMRMSLKDVVTKPARPHTVRPKPEVVTKKEDRKSDFGITDPILAMAVCGRWR